MSENRWTATTSTYWIFFDENHTLKTTTGNSGGQINVYINEAETPDDEAEGEIRISVNDDIFTKTIKRCLPTATSVEKVLSFSIDYKSAGGGAGPCVNGTSTIDSDGINVIDIKLTTTTTYSSGKSVIDVKNLSNVDVNISYKLPGDDNEYPSLPANEDKERTVTVKLQLKDDQSITATNTFIQRGIKDSNGNYILKEDTTGRTTESISYENFNFASSNINHKTESCEAGTYQYNITGSKVTSYGGISGLTECNEPKTNMVESSSATNITTNDVTFTVTPNDTAYFNGNVLYYDENDTRTVDKVYTITATLTADTSITRTTTFTVTASNDCGASIYIHIKSNKNAIEYAGGNAEIRYYLSEHEEDDESYAITDESILNNLNFACQQGIQSCGDDNVVLVNGVYKRKVYFSQNPNLEIGGGINWEFTASCQMAVNNPQKIKIYQADAYENLIPNCDYFVFNYNWEDSDGKDLDSLTHITNVPTLMSNHGENVSAYTVGYLGTSVDTESKQYTYIDKTYATYLTFVNGKDGLLYLKHGGDNRASGAEGAIVCMKNILKSKQVSVNDTIYIDVYANWFAQKLNGNMSITYRQFTGTTENGNYSDEINETPHIFMRQSDIMKGLYYTFEPVDGKCELINEPITTNLLHVNAAGMDNPSIARYNVDCIDGAYTHVLRLSYNVSTNSTSLYTDFPDNGIDIARLMKKLYINGVEHSSGFAKFYVPISGDHVTYDNVYCKYTYLGEERVAYIFTDSNQHDGSKDYIYCNEYVGNSDPNKRIYEYGVGDLGTYKDFSYIKNFVVNKNPDGTLKIDFDVDSTSIDTEFDFSPWLCLNFGLPCVKSNKSNIKFIEAETFQKINNPT